VNNPVATRWRLSEELRRLRNQAELTQRQVAEDLDWSPSKMIRIENGSVGVGLTDLRALLDRYGVHNGQVVDELVEMARASKRQPYSEYREILTPDTIRFLGYEASASIIRQFEPLVLPGLLQTEKYTRALLDIYEIPAAKADLYVASRHERQEIFDRQNLPELFFIIDESVLLRPIGGRPAMRHQLQRLLQVASHPRVTIQVLPFASGAHAGLRGPFVMLEFPTLHNPDVLYLENRLGSDRTFIDEPEITGAYRATFWAMEDQASKPDELNEYVQRALNTLGTGEAPTSRPPPIPDRG
jgi:transcriptional regulator with XRE-family HTH domain